MKAFTLVETLASVLIFSVISLSIFAVMVLGQRSWSTGGAETELRKEVIRAMIAMNKELSETSVSKINLTAGVSRNIITFQIPNDNNADGSVVTTSGAIEWSVPITYSFDAANNFIRRTSALAGQPAILGRDIASLQFTQGTGLQNRLIWVDITAQKRDNTGRLLQDSEQSVIKMRN